MAIKEGAGVNRQAVMPDIANHPRCLCQVHVPGLDPARDLASDRDFIGFNVARDDGLFTDHQLGAVDVAGYNAVQLHFVSGSQITGNLQIC